MGALGFSVSQAEDSGVFAAAARISTLPLFNVAMIMFAGCLLAALRFQRVASDLGYRLRFREAAAIYASGQLAGVLFFQLPGQLLARGALLAQRAVPPSGAIIITGYERLCSLIVSLVLATLSAIYLFGQIHLDLTGGGMALVKIAAGLTAAMVGGALVGWGRFALDLAPILARFDPWLFLRTLALSLLIQLATMAGYIVLVMSMVDNVSVLTLAAASCLIMLAASLPISFAGWGVREMSAIAALGAVGVSVHVSFVVALLMGVISIAVVGLLLPLARQPKASPASKDTAAALPFIDYTAILSIVLPLAAATAVFFQIFVPVNGGKLNVNLADPIVLLAGAFFAILHLGRGWPEWRVPHFNSLAAAATAVLVLAYLHGLMSFGWSDWAFSNKLLGWFVLLGYAATGALIVRHASERGLELLLETFVGVAVAIVTLEVMILFALRLGVDWLMPLAAPRMSGLSHNPNAFAFMLLLASCVVVSGRWQRSAALFGMLLFGLLCTGSRAAFFALPVMLGMALYMRALSWRFLAKSTSVAIVLLVLFATVLPLISAVLSSDPAGMANYLRRSSAPSSDVERWLTLRDGWNMFLGNPVFGTGLGAYMEEQLRAGRAALVIHSVPIWLLAEMGLVGLVAMAAPVVAIFANEARRRDNDMAGTVLVLIVTVFATVALVHDIMYQRGFWLILGAALATRAAIRRPDGRQPGA